MNDINNSDVKDTDNLTSKIQKAEPSFWDYESTENQFLKKYNFILADNAKERLGIFYTYIKQNPGHH